MGKLIKLFDRKGGSKMSVFEVAEVFLEMGEDITNKKLQKLCYYAQSWHLALYEEPLFDDKFQAWVHGPVCRELYLEYKDYRWNIPSPDEFDCTLDSRICEFLEMVYDTYGEFDGDELELLTHSELPWQEARKGLEEWEASDKEISEETMRKFYREVYEQDRKN